MDYLKDGAVAEGSAKAEEYQFITHVLHGELVTERLLRLHNKHITERELKEQLSREKTEQLKRNASDIEGGDKKYDDDDNVEEEIFLSSHPSAIGGTITSLQIKDIIFSCEQHKTGGNEAFQNGEYLQAILLYTRGIDESVGVERFFPDRHVLFANRSACFLKMGHHEKALEDAQKCVEIQPSYIKGHFRKGLALHALKRYEEAMPCLVQALQMEPKNKQIQQAIKFCEVNLTKEMRKRMEGK
jgi:tetratricopeptide (TPR) repeat protein